MATQTGSIDLKGMTSAYSDQQQYFWVESSSSATWGGGAHITNIAESAFKTAAGTWGTDPTAGGYNLLMNTDTANATGSLQLRNGSLPIMNLDNNSLDFNVIDTTSGTYVNVASFGSTTTIGAADDEQAYMFLNYRSIQGIDKEGDTYFYVSDLRDANGDYSARDTFVGNGVTTVFTLSIGAFSNLVVKVNDVEQTINVDYTYDSSNWKITFISPPTDGAIINVTYISRNQNSKAYTFGNRATGSVIGGMSVAEGRLTTASGYSSHAEGKSTIASGTYSHTEGSYATASGHSSHAEGGTLDINGTVTHNIASGYGSHAEGAGTTASKQSAHAEGTGTTASGHSSHAEGGTRITDGTVTYTIASGSVSHAEGAGTTASGNVSHAEGAGTTASGFSSHAEGGETIASALSAHAEGNVTTASGQSAHAEGMRSVASGSESHAQNYYTKASSFAQTAIGKYNIEDTANTYSFILGNGTSDTNRSNALTVDWLGNLEATEYYTKPRTLNLGVCVCGAILTTDASALYFTIPTGRVFPSGTTITRITGDMSVRASNRNSTGMYIVKSSSGGSSGAAFDTAASVVSTFYDGANNKRTPSVKPSLNLYGGTNIYFAWATGTNNYFSGNATNTGYVNNQACMVMLTNLVVYLS